MAREQDQNFDLSITYSGDLVEDNLLDLRTYANTLFHLSAAVDRALLSHERGSIYKNARITSEERQKLNLTVLDPENNGIILKFLAKRNSRLARRVSAKIASFIEDADNRAPEATITPREIRERIAQLQNQDEIEVQDIPDQDDDFAKKATCREINLILSEVRHDDAGRSFITLKFKDEDGAIHSFEFDRNRAERFNRIVTGRSIIGPFIYRLRIKGLDLINNSKMHAKCIDVETDKIRTLYFKDEADLQKLKDYLTTDDEVAVNIYGFSITEFNVVDNIAGDIHFIAIQE